MSLAPDSRLGPYEIVGKLGAGGMGEVYRARDPRLGRIVAVKLLTHSGDPGLRQRFEQEARAASALNHPNILTVHDVGEQNGAQYIVSELVEGEPLRALIQRGPAPLRKTLDIATQIADGLAAAHKAGIAHRDLKPENVMLTPDGRAKILDFGLAKRTGRAAPAEHEPTVTQATEAGMVIGTAGYMSPEQARGEEVDTRTDQFSFGTMLYEMLSGKQPFRRASGPETMAAVIAEEPPALAADVPAPVRWVVERCMDKDPARRYGSTLDLFRDLAKLRDGLSEISAVTIARPRAPMWPWLAAAVLASAATTYLLHKQSASPSSPHRPLSLEINPPPGTRFDLYGFKVSPDGRSIAFVTIAPTRGRQLWVRNLETGAMREVRTEGTEVSSPFWSPDSRRLGFTNGASIYVSDGDGAARRVAKASGVTYPSWDATAGIVFTEGGRILTVSPSGGEPKLRSTGNPINGLVSAVIAMPGAKRFGFEYRTKAGVGVGFGDGATNRLLFTNPNSPPRFAWSVERNATYVFAVDQGQLKVRRLDPESGEIQGEPAILADYVAYGPTFSASNTGVLAYHPEAPSGTYQYAILDRAGKQTGSLGLAGPSGVVRISPDGRRAALSRRDGEGLYHLWLADLDSGRATPFTFGADSDNFPVWAPGGDQIYFIRTSTNRRARRVMRIPSPAPAQSRWSLKET